ncbi:MAG: DUF433 domain-containing protein [Ignavibacteria bacterium]|nr:DUF433 domain-containing protein [Ignavibacteria bacterium]MCC7158730.1 DUF433 domain-containing protein [Ignavibacteria bacterium]
MENSETAKLLERITFDPRVMGGKALIRGLRISVKQVIKALASGVPEKDILSDYPELEKEDIQAVLLYASNLVEEERVFEV